MCVCVRAFQVALVAAAAWRSVIRFLVPTAFSRIHTPLSRDTAWQQDGSTPLTGLATRHLCACVALCVARTRTHAYTIARVALTHETSEANQQRLFSISDLSRTSIVRIPSRNITARTHEARTFDERPSARTFDERPSASFHGLKICC